MMDIFLMKLYVIIYFDKIFQWRVSIHWYLTFAKEFRGYKVFVCVPALELMCRLIRKDLCAMVHINESVWYIIIAGAPNQLKHCTRISEVITNPVLTPDSISINSNSNLYYLTKIFISCFNLNSLSFSLLIGILSTTWIIFEFIQ